jgi:putative ABC transport system permease protein
MWTDFRRAARLLARDRGLTLSAVAALTIGMSATMTMYAIIHAVYLRDLPFAAPDRIVAIGTRYLTPGQESLDNLSYPDLRDLAALARTFDGIVAADEASMDVWDASHAAERFVGAWISARTFSLLGHRPVLGRDFTADDERAGAEPVVMLGHEVWRTRYASDRAIVGHRIRVEGVTSTVIGVMPDGVGFPNRAELWRPLAGRRGDGTERGNRNIDTFGRMATGVTIEQAQDDLARVMARLSREFPETNANVTAIVRPFRAFSTSGPIRAVFAGLMGSVIFLLVIACANVANLLLARGAARAREVTVRMSLGATRRQVMRQLLAESLLLALVAGALSFGLASYGARLFARSTAAAGAPYWVRSPFEPAVVEPGVIAFVVLACIGTTVLCGLAPALQTTKATLNQLLGDGGRAMAGTRRGRRWGDAFVVVQLALGLILLAGAGLMIRNVYEFARIDIGVNASRLVSAQISLPGPAYPGIEQRRVFYRQLSDRLVSLPGLRAGITSAAPLRGAALRRLSIDRPIARAADGPTASTVAVGPGYLEALGLSAVQGRLFTRAEGEGGLQPVVVNERFAQLHLGTGGAVGRTIHLEPLPGAEGESLVVIGVVHNVRQASPRQEIADGRVQEPVLYLPFEALAPPSATIVVSGDAAPGAVASALRAAIAAIDADLPLFNVTPLGETMEEELGLLTVFGAMFGMFAASALLLSTVGLYGVTAYTVTQRTREVGVRVALGARNRHLWWLVMRRVMVQLAVGIGIGLAGALAVGQLLQSLLAGIGSRDPLTLIGVPVLMITVALIACAIPAVRAMRMNPVAALRE